ncbi:MAG: response regulator [Thiohalocapsa sp. PB-PSB1]|nr:MAG: hypothetical protein N838_00010 [Thiohalocapsa sp. PB-PSB1]QQO52390.1 MAG: response regulator [Thiohalocapsa sp. PB-PSB1]HCS92942.1 hybrid sensor histidine kinase/response regulator [Chromatiaceae bacterium]
MKLRYYILILLLLFGLTPLLLAVLINLPLVLDRTAMFYQKAYLQNLRADFRDLDQHLASRDEMIRMLAKLPEPGVILGEGGSEDEVDMARARYTGWINQMLADQADVIQILFLDDIGNERFWLRRDRDSKEWRPTELPPEPPNRGFVNAGMKLQAGEVIVSRIRINPYAASEDPRQLMTLQLASPIGEITRAGGRRRGLLLMSIDVGGLAQFYRDTLWVNNNGSYLRPGKPFGEEPGAFQDFPGLEQIFADAKLALWKGNDGQQLLWVPMFLTEDAEPLWVGRQVDPSPLEEFRNALIARVLTIVLLLVVVVLLIARWLASRAERFGHELISGIATILGDGEPKRFAWSGPREVHELGNQLNALARTHAEHIATDRQHTRQLEQSNRYKSEFLANVSHELRTPLNSILLLSKMLAARESKLDAEQRRQAQIIHEAGRDLRAMIDNVLDISRLEAGPVTVCLEWVELRPMLAELVAMVGPIFNDKGLNLRVETDPMAPPRIYSDRDKLRQIVKNFLSNAAKFTETGGVVVSLAPGDSTCPLAIAVADTGIGIAPGKEDVIFNAFQQADGSTRRRYGGTGLGLSISRELAHLLGGRIEVESMFGQGSRFTLYLPLSLDPEELDAVEIIQERDQGGESAPTSVLPVQSLDPGKTCADNPTGRGRGEHWVLLLERDVHSLVTIAAQLEALGVRVQTAADGEEALETLQDERDCALLLLATPVSQQQSCDTITAVRTQLGLGNLPIVMLGDMDQAQRQQCLEAGASGFLEKPIVIESLEAMLDAALAGRREPSACAMDDTTLQVARS